MKKHLVVLSVLSVFFTSCVKEEDNLDTVDKWVGVWTCAEVEGDFAPQTYDIEIIGKTEGNQVSVVGLYNQGSSFFIDAEVSGDLIEIPQQTEYGITIYGDGVINTADDMITLFFTANDGAGPDNVKAILNR